MSPAVTQLIESAKALSIEQQMELFDALREMLDEHAEPDGFELTPEQRAEIDRRWKKHVRHPESAIGWDEAKVRLAALRQKYTKPAGDKNR